MVTEPQKDVFVMNDITDKIKAGLGNGRGTFLLALFGIGISVSASFMFCLASIGFDFTQLKDIVFWSRWASMAITSLVGYFLVILHKDEKNRMLPWYKECLDEIARKASQIGESFDEFLHDLNLRRRIEWYKRAVNDKIALLNKKLLEADLRGKPTAAIAQKIEKYKAIISDEFISANKNALKTRSKTISSVQVLSEARRGDNGETNFRSASGFYVGKGTAKVVMSLIMTAAFACVVVQNFGAGISIASIVMTVLSVLSTVISVFSAVLAANGCYRNVYVPNMLFRLKILSDYEEWKKKKEGKNLGANWGQTSAPPQKTAVSAEK